MATDPDDPLASVFRAGTLGFDGRASAAWHVTSCETMRPVPVVAVEIAARTLDGRAVAALLRVEASGDALDLAMRRACGDLVRGDRIEAARPGPPMTVRRAIFADVVARMWARTDGPHPLPWPGASTEGLDQGVAATLAAFLSTLDGAALAALRDRDGNDVLHGCWEGFDATFTPGAPLRHAMRAMPHLTWTLAEGWRSGRTRFDAGADRVVVVAAALAEAKASRQLPGWLISGFAVAEEAYAKVQGSPPEAYKVPSRSDDAFFDAAMSLDDLPTNWVPSDTSEWVAFFEVQPLFAGASALDPTAPFRAVLACGGRWARWRESLCVAAGVRLDGLRRALRDVADVERAFARQVVDPGREGLGNARLHHDGQDVARQALWRGRTLRAALEASRTWHRRRARIDAALSALPGRKGAPTSWPAVMPPLSADGLELVPLDTVDGLVAEGAAGPDRDGHPGLDHCVASYKGNCLQGRFRIASIRRVGGARLSTVCFEMGAHAKVLDHRGLRNADAPAEAKDFLTRYMTAIGRGELQVGKCVRVPGFDGSVDRAGYDASVPGNREKALSLWRGIPPRGLGPLTPARLAPLAWGAEMARGMPARAVPDDPAGALRVLLPFGQLWRGGRVTGFWFAGPLERSDGAVAYLLSRRKDGSHATATVHGPAANLAEAVAGTVHRLDEAVDLPTQDTALDRDGPGQVAGMLSMPEDFVEPPADASLARLGREARMLLDPDTEARYAVECYDALATRLLAEVMPSLGEADAAVRAHRSRLAGVARRFRATCDPGIAALLPAARDGRWREIWHEVDGGRRFATPLREAMAAYPHLAWPLSRHRSFRLEDHGTPKAWNVSALMTRCGRSHQLDLAHDNWVRKRFPEVQAALARRWPRGFPDFVGPGRPRSFVAILGCLGSIPAENAPSGAADWSACLSIVAASLAPYMPVGWSVRTLDLSDGWTGAHRVLLEAADGDLEGAMLRRDQRALSFLAEVVRPAAVLQGADTFGLFTSEATHLLDGAEPGGLAGLLAADRRWRIVAPRIRAGLDALPGGRPDAWPAVLPEHLDGETGLRVHVITDMAGVLRCARSGPVAKGVEGSGLEGLMTDDAVAACMTGARRYVAFVKADGSWPAVLALNDLRGPVAVEPYSMIHFDDEVLRHRVASALVRYLEALDRGDLVVDVASLDRPVAGQALPRCGYDASVPGNVDAALDLWRPMIPVAMRDHDAGWWVDTATRNAAEATRLYHEREARR